MDVGIVHPGLMGQSLAAACTGRTWWASEGRTTATAQRAEATGIRDSRTLEALCCEVDTIVSICPPGAAASVAHAVADLGFAGLYVDANAIAPAVARDLGTSFERFIDGSVIGPPAHTPGTTRLYLSGGTTQDQAALEALWRDGPLEVVAIGGGVGAASALKMAYASWTKVGGALQLAIRALAEAEGVAEPLLGEWNRSQPGLAARSERVAGGVAPKAWRFTGEMEQISRAFADAGLSPAFGAAGLDIYRRLAGLQHAEDPDLDLVVQTLLGAEHG